MKSNARLLGLCAVLVASAALPVLGGCEVILDFDRTKIDAGAEPSDGSLPDGTTEAGSDGGDAGDAGDARADGGPDTGTDAGTDAAGQDAGADTGTDAATTPDASDAGAEDAADASDGA